MDVTMLREQIARLVSLDPNDDFGIEKCWNEMTAILSKDISSTIHFFENDCMNEELYWLGSVFEDVADRTQSKEFIQALRNRLAKVNREAYCQQDFKTEHMQKWVGYAEYVRSISADIDFAEGKIEE